MQKMFGLVFAAMLATGACTSARAETQEEQAFGFGSFAGAAVFCGVPKDAVTNFSDKLLRTVGVDTTADDNPAMKKFTEGVTAGIVEMRDHPQVDCATVKSTFEDLNKKLQ